MIILDINKPISDGFEVCKKMFGLLNKEVRKINPHSKRKMPLLVACSSTARTKQLEQDLYLIGLDMFIDTPISDDKVGELISILERKENHSMSIVIKDPNTPKNDELIPL